MMNFKKEHWFSGSTSRALLVLAMMGLFVGTVAVAAKLKLQEDLVMALPGVDEAGNLDFETLFDGTAKAVFNTKNGKFVAKVKGSDPIANQSGKTFKLKKADIDSFPDILMEIGVDPADVDGTVSYKVTKKGKISGVAKGTLTGPLPV